MKKYLVKLNGKEYEVEIEEVSRQENEAAASQTPAQEQEKAPQAAPKAAGATGAGAKVNAPMPGSIVDVKVKEGDRVKEGDVLLVLESMKMMNEIVAPQAGEITSVGVRKGDMVSSGDAMITIA